MRSLDTIASILRTLFASGVVLFVACAAHDDDAADAAMPVGAGAGGAAPIAGGSGGAGIGVGSGAGGATVGTIDAGHASGAPGAAAGTGARMGPSGTGGMMGAGGPGLSADSNDARGDSGVPGASARDASSSASHIQHVFVIALENHDEGSIIGNMKDASYINGELLVKYAGASDFVDRLPLGVPSEPHYVWMEAGTNAFSDHTFGSDDPASASNSTGSTEHLSTQLGAAGLTWIAYQEGIDATSGACPIQPSGYYQPKHDPFIFFRDVSGNPPSKTNAECAAHHKPYSALADDLANDRVAHYNFITPDQCHDMHGQSGCPNSNGIQAGDDWLRENVPPLIEYCDAHDGVVFLVWDEGESTLQIPFLALGARIKPGYVSPIELDHGSLAKSVETIFDLPVLAKVRASNDFSDLFRTGMFP
jgi:hypothetical protein